MRDMGSPRSSRLVAALFALCNMTMVKGQLPSPAPGPRSWSPPDSVLAVHVNADGLFPAFGSSTAATRVLANVSLFLWGPNYLAQFSEVGEPDRWLLPTQSNGPNFACTLPAAGAEGSGQLSLSADGRLVSLACFGHAPGTRLQDTSIAVIALVDMRIVVDTRTSVTLSPGEIPFAAVTDNGTSAWLATSAGVVHVLVGSSGTAGTPIFSQSEVRHITIFDGVALWMSVPAASAVLQLNCTAAVFGGGDGSLPPYPDRFAALPRTADAAADCAITPVLKSRDAGLYGHATMLQPRGPNIYDYSLGAFFTLDAAAMPSSPLVALTAADGGGPRVNAVSFTAPAAVGDAWPAVPSLRPARNLTLSSQLDVRYLAAVGTRFVDHIVNDTFGWPDLGLSVPKVLGCVLASSGRALVNYTLLDRHMAGSQAYIARYIYKLPAAAVNTQRFAGVSMAPFDNALPIVSPTSNPLPTRVPTSTSTPTASVSRLSSPKPTTSPAPLDPGPKMAGDALLMRGQLSEAATQELIYLLLRVGDPADARSATLPLTRARPLFVDVVHRNGSLLATMALPTATTVTGSVRHRRCVASFTSLPLKLRHSSHLVYFASMPCYDAEAWVDDLIMGTDRDAAALAGRRIAQSPLAVVARIFGEWQLAVVMQLHVRFSCSPRAWPAVQVLIISIRACIPTSRSSLPPRSESARGHVHGGFAVRRVQLHDGDGGADPAARRRLRLRLCFLCWHSQPAGRPS